LQYTFGSPFWYAERTSQELQAPQTHSRGMQRATLMDHATGSLQHATFNIRRAACHMQRATYDMQRATHVKWHAMCNVQSAARNVQHAASYRNVVQRLVCS
jgi:hypothetical protein